MRTRLARSPRHHQYWRWSGTDDRPQCTSGHIGDDEASHVIREKAGEAKTDHVLARRKWPTDVGETGRCPWGA